MSRILVKLSNCRRKRNVWTLWLLSLRISMSIFRSFDHQVNRGGFFPVPIEIKKNPLLERPKEQHPKFLQFLNTHQFFVIVGCASPVSHSVTNEFYTILLTCWKWIDAWRNINQLHTVSCTQECMQREPSVKTFRSPFPAVFRRHCVLSGSILVLERRNENVN